MQRPSYVGAQIDGAALRRLRRLDPSEIDGPLDIQRPGPEVDVPGGEGERFARPQAALRQQGKQRRIARVSAPAIDSAAISDARVPMARQCARARAT